MLGGPAAVSEQVLTDVRALGPVVERVSGPDRYATAAEVQRLGHDSGALDPGVVTVVRGDTSADALGVAGRACQLGTTTVLTRPGDLPAASRALVEDIADTLFSGLVVGGRAAVSDAVRTQVANAGTGAGTRGDASGVGRAGLGRAGRHVGPGGAHLRPGREPGQRGAGPRRRRRRPRGRHRHPDRFRSLRQAGGGGGSTRWRA